MEAMKIIVVSINDSVETVEAGSNVVTALEILDYQSDDMLGVAINKVFIAKEKWETTLLKNNDQIDILNPISGG